MGSLPAESNGGFPIKGTRTHAPLPSGRHALPEEVVAEHQRARLLEAMLEVVGECGYEETAVQDVLVRASTSRRVFYIHYTSKADCYLAAYRAAVERAENLAVAAAASRAGGWRESIRAALAALLGYLEEDPAAGRAMVIEVHAAGPEAQRARTEAMRRAARALDELRAAEPGGAGSPPSAITSEGVLGGIEHAVRTQLRRGEPAELGERLGELMHFVVLSYLGPAAAARELQPTES